MSRRPLVVALLLVACAACSSGKSQSPAAPAAAAPVAAARTAPPQPGPAAAPDPNTYVPAEFKTGAARWKDTGVYLDGKPIGFLTFGELPVTLQPTWIKDKVSANKRYGTNDPGWRWAEERYYKFNDYLRALGIDPKTVKELHVLGPHPTDSIVVSGKELASRKGDAFLFRFGGVISGKAIPQVPPDFGNHRKPDKISAVMIYVEKQPPTLVPDDGFYLNGQYIDGVPYYGEPLRGGVRIYLDDRLAAIIKRQDLDPKLAIDAPDGQRWSLYGFLKAHGVDPSHIVEGYVIRDERRQDKLDGKLLPTMTFGATAQAKGVVTLGDARIPANAIALHTRALRPDQLPVIHDDEY